MVRSYITLGDAIVPLTRKIRAAPKPGRWIAACVLEKPRFGESAETYRVTGGRARPRYLKIASLQTAPALDSEAERLAWLGGRLPVPELLGSVREDGSDYLLMSEVPGVTVGEAEDVPAAHRVKLLARGLRKIHSLAPSTCLFDSRLTVRLGAAEERLRAGY